MFLKIINKFNTLTTHHQLIFAALATLSFIVLTWGIEKLLESYLFPSRPVVGYFLAVIGSLGMLVLVQHFVLHVF